MKKETYEEDEIDKLIEQKKQNGLKRVLLPIDFIPSVISFSEGAYEKADMVGPIIKDLTGDDFEWSAFLLAKKNDPEYTIRDLLIQKGQNIGRANVEISGEDIAKASNQVSERNNKYRTNFYVIGWIHGHGVYELFPSSTDKKNFNKVINSVSLNTEQKINSPLNLIEKDIVKNLSDRKLIYRGKALEDAVIEHTLPDKQRLEEILLKHGVNFTLKNLESDSSELALSILESVQTEYYQSNIFGFAYFVIMNNLHHKPYAAIGLKNEKAITKTGNTMLTENLDIKRVIVNNDIEIDEEALREEIKKSVDYDRGVLSSVSSFFGSLASWPVHYEGREYIPQAERGVYIEGSLFKAIGKRIKSYRGAGDIKRANDLKAFVNMLKDSQYIMSSEEIADVVDNFLTSVYKPLNRENNPGGKNAQY